MGTITNGRPSDPARRISSSVEGWSHLSGPTRDWYSAFKSRPSFGPLLSERMDVIQPPAHYNQLDD